MSEAKNATVRKILEQRLSLIREGDGEHPTPSGVPKVVYPHVGLIAGEVLVRVRRPVKPHRRHSKTVKSQRYINNDVGER